MKNYTVRLSVMFFCVCAVLPAVYAQSRVPGMPDTRGDDSDLSRRMNEMRRMSEPNDRANPPKKTKNIDSKLKVSKDLSSKYATFLKNPQTGIFNILPVVICQQTDIIARQACEDEKAAVRFFANAYSFREKKNASPVTSDLSLADDSFKVGAQAVQSIIVRLGDVPLDNLTPESDGMSFLIKYKPEQEPVKVNEQFAQIKQGINDGKYFYSKSLPANENTTYALRSIAYYSDEMLPGGKKADVTVAFRVVKRDGDGMLTILWKELDRKDAVKLKN